MDIVRCAAIFLVVLQHCWTMLDLDLLKSSHQYPFYSSIIYGVALFVMLSGALHLRKIDRVATFYKKRIVRVLIPFVFWGTIVYVISYVVGKYEDMDCVGKAVRMYFPYFMTGKINEAYWFVYLILALYLVTPILQRFLHKGNDMSVLVILLSLIGIWLVVESIFSIGGILGTFIFYSGYYLTGYFIVRYVSAGKFSAFAGAAGSLVFYGLNVLIQSQGSESFAISFCEVSCLFILFSSLNISGRVSSGISRYSYLIYLTHFVLIRAFYVVFPEVFVPVWYMPVLTAVLVMAIECLFCAGIEKIPWMPKKVIGL